MESWKFITNELIWRRIIIKLNWNIQFIRQNGDYKMGYINRH